jgi:hypothetical protein
VYPGAPIEGLEVVALAGPSPKDKAMLRRDWQMSAKAESSGDQSAPPASPNSVAAAGVVDANPKDKAMLRRQYQLTA